MRRDVKFSEREYDVCIGCGVQTDYKTETPVNFRDNYVEGAGQLCKPCFKKVYENGK